MKRFIAYTILFFAYTLSFGQEKNMQTIWDKIYVPVSNLNLVGIRDKNNNRLAGALRRYELFCSINEENKENQIAGICDAYYIENPDGYERGVGYLNSGFVWASDVRPISSFQRLSKASETLKHITFSNGEFTVEIELDLAIRVFAATYRPVAITIKKGAEYYQIPASAFSEIPSDLLYKCGFGVFIGDDSELYIVMAGDNTANGYLLSWTVVDMKLRIMNQIFPLF